jgi:hypothetical protein
MVYYGVAFTRFTNIDKPNVFEGCIGYEDREVFDGYRCYKEAPFCFIRCVISFHKEAPRILE